MNKPVNLGMSILNISKTLMYKFWYGDFKPKNGDRAKLCDADTDSFIIHIITEDFFKDISNDAEKCHDTSNYLKNDKRPLPIGKNKTKNIIILRYGNNHKKAKGAKKVRNKTKTYVSKFQRFFIQ